MRSARCRPSGSWCRPDGDGTFEHIAVGPPGVFFLSAELGDALELDDDSDDDVPSADPTRGVGTAATSAAKRLRKELEQETGLRLWVQPVVVIEGPHVEEPLLYEQVAYVHSSYLAEWLTDRPGWLALRQRRLVEFALNPELGAAA